MKHVFLSLALGCVVATAGFAQCDPDFSFPDGVAFGLSPDPLADETFVDGYLGEDYADTIHMLIPLDATELVGAPLAIDSIVVQSISLIGESGESLLIADVGLELTPNNNGDSPNLFTFMGGEQYCATLTGIPDTTGFFQASIDVEGWSNFLGNPLSQPVSFEGYTLTLILEGCTDETACNFESLATIDDGSCAELDALNECGGNCFEVDSNGECVEEIALGCLDPLACNYDELANTDDGSCLVIGESCDDMDENTINDIVLEGCVCQGDTIILGCTDSAACNFSAEANVDDDSCLVIGDACDDMNAETTNDTVTGECECLGEAIVEGCMDDMACNYDMNANVDDMSCELPGDPCDDMDAETANDSLNVDCDCVGDPVSLILEQEELSLKVYPNPTMGELVIVLPVGHAFDLTMVSLSGQTVLSSQTTKGGPVVWEVEGVPAGAYLLHVRNEHATAVRRVLVGGR